MITYSFIQDQVVFPDQFNGYTRIEYMSVFVSFLYAFVIAEFFAGWSKMVRSRQHLKISVDHLIYSILFFWILILNWWSLWIRMNFLGEGFVYFLLVIIPLAISYFVSILLFPELDKEPDLGSYFDKNFKLVGIGISMFILTNIGVGILLEEEAGLINAFRTVIGIFIFIVAFFNLKKLKRILAVIIGILLLLGTIRFAFT